MPSVGNDRNALLAQIRQGAKLKPVSTDSDKDSGKSSVSSNGGGLKVVGKGGGGGGRDALMNQIRNSGRSQLRPVAVNADRKPSQVLEPGGMAAALKKALEARQKMINSDSEDDSDSSCPDEEEWADDD